jgi:hypothetical protein
LGGGSGLIAVGEETIDRHTNAAVWTSPDGVHWERVPDAADMFGGPGIQRMYAAATTPSGIVAGGVDGSRGGIWVSANGDTWESLGQNSDTSALTRPEHQIVKVLMTTIDRPELIALGTIGQGKHTEADAWTATPR